MKTTYINSFYHRDLHINNGYIKPEFHTDATPIEYNGYEIYKHSHIEYHIVKDGVCLSMVGSIRYAKVKIDCGLDMVKTSTEFKRLYGDGHTA